MKPKLPLHEGLFVIGELWAKYVLPVQRRLYKSIFKLILILLFALVLLWQIIGVRISNEIKKNAWEDGKITRHCIKKYGPLNTDY